MHTPLKMQPHGSNPQTSRFLCNSCDMRFVTAELQRQHMKLEWHRYNLKRRVAHLPPISSHAFAEKVLAQAASDNEDEDGFHVYLRRRGRTGVKQVTKKDLKRSRGRGLQSEAAQREPSPAHSFSSTFSGLSLGDSHASELETELPSELSYSDTGDETWLLSDSAELELEPDSDNEDVPPIHHCFYCGKNNGEVELNVKHMSRAHGLYIPERSYLVDLDGLLSFMNEVINVDNECLACGFQGKGTESVRKHMLNKGHCRLPYELRSDKNLVAEFYNFDVGGPTAAATTKRVAFVEPSQLHALVPTGKIAHRLLLRNRVRRSVPELVRTVVVGRNLPALLVQYRRDERAAWALVTRAANRYDRKLKMKRINHQRHFRDTLLGPM